ncbi:hypothetical protein EI94DRAFT_1796734 [Lactarius quietus]|nr:hypothetical protein EI94DRAFT_1796734 [Lactarius quietus]
MATRNQINGEPTQTTVTCPASRCPLPSWSRTFSNNEALLEHARQTRAQHPLCTICLRVFKDTAALEQHVEAKHVVICQPCNRKYKSQSAIDQHWRSSTAHPNCPVCGAGAPDTPALAEHIANAHPKIRCCGILLSENDLDAHYLTSRNHPTCGMCNIGFATELEYAEHNSHVHSELQCKVCAEQFPSPEALWAHTADPSSHRRCEFCNAEFKETSALVEHYTETHLSSNDVQDMSNSVIDVSTRSPTPPMNRAYAPLSLPTPGAVVEAGHTTASPAYPRAPPSRASTGSHSAGGSEMASGLIFSPNSASTIRPSPNLGDSSSSGSPSHSHPKSQSPSITTGPPPPGLGNSSSSVSHAHTHWSFNNNRPAAVQSPRPGSSSDGPFSDHATITAVHRSAHASPTPAQLTRSSPYPAAPSPHYALSSSPASAPSPPLPIPVRAEGPVDPVTPARNGVLIASSPQLHDQQQHLQRQQRQLPHPPSSARSKGSVAETPSGDLANFHLLKGSPLQSVVDFDTPTPSPRTPSASPADQQAFLLASRTGAPYYPLADGRRFMPGSSGISPTYARTHRAAADAIPETRSLFFCRVCQVDPCREITATACGHVFCNACIVEEVRENARCPVCNAAVLLFALLKLDLSQV